MTDTNTRDRWSDLEAKAKAVIGYAATPDIATSRAEDAMIAKADAERWQKVSGEYRAVATPLAFLALISHARAVEAENERLRGAMEKMVRTEDEARERLQKAGIQINPTPEVDALRAALTEPRAGEG